MNGPYIHGTSTFLYFNLYFNTAYAARNDYFTTQMYGGRENIRTYEEVMVLLGRCLYFHKDNLCNISTEKRHVSTKKLDFYRESIRVFLCMAPPWKYIDDSNDNNIVLIIQIQIQIVGVLPI